MAAIKLIFDGREYTSTERIFGSNSSASIVSSVPDKRAGRMMRQPSKVCHVTPVVLDRQTLKCCTTTGQEVEYKDYEC